MRLYFWGLLLLPIIVFVSVFSLSYKPTLNLLDSDVFVLNRFIDSTDGGRSLSYIKKTDSAFYIRCELRNGCKYPYAGIQISKQNDSLFDISEFMVSIKLKINKDVRLSVRMGQFIDGYTDPANATSYLTVVKGFGFNQGYNELEIPVTDICEIQDWWFMLNPKMINKFRAPYYNNTRWIWLYVENTTPLNTPLEISLEQFELQYSFQKLLYRFSAIAFVYYVVLLLIMWKVKKVKYILMPIELSKIGNRIPEMQRKILSYIGSNYTNSELNLEDVAQSIGISPDQVTELLRKHCELTFRQYLNQVRLEEAKRLLRNSECQISEIAFKVGYNNIQHFNRVFKEYTSFTPSGFRELK